MDKNVFCVIGLSLIFAAAGDAFAAPEFVANVSVRTGVTPSFDGGPGKRFAVTSEFTPVFFQSTPTIIIQGDTSGRGLARAGAGELGVYADASQGLQGGTLQFYANVVETSSFAQFTLHDFMVSPIVVGNPQTFVNLILRFAVDGRLAIPFSGGSVFDTATLNNFPDDPFASADTQLMLDARIRRPDGSYSVGNGGFARISSNTTNAGNTTSGMATSGAFGGQEAALQSGDPFTVEMLFSGVPVNELLDLTVGFSAKAQTAVGFPQGGGLWESAARVGFDQTLSFATDRVATLPRGFTLNSPSGNIANNVWTPEPSPVPLPATLALLASALLTLARRPLRLAWLDRAIPRRSVLVQGCA